MVDWCISYGTWHLNSRTQGHVDVLSVSGRTVESVRCAVCGCAALCDLSSSRKVALARASGEYKIINE